jgi:predicted aspartyl protease
MNVRGCARSAVLGQVVLALAVGGAERALSQQAAGSAGAEVKHSCVVDTAKPTEADMALLARNYADAEQFYGATLSANHSSTKAMAGQVRTLLGEDKLAEALALAIKYDHEHPDQPDLLNALGEARFRRGEVDEAATTFNASVKVDPCNGVTHWDMARFMNLSGMYASAQYQLEFAHALSPQNPEITRRWRATHAVPPTAEQRLAALRERLGRPAIGEEEKEGINAAIKGIETREKGDCALVSPAAEVNLPIVPISNRGGAATPRDMYAAGLDVQFNGKRERLVIDTGASGLLLSRSVAKDAGLVPEVETKSGGIGDKGPVKAFVTHVDDIKIGSMEFKNCMVRVLEPGGALEVDGLIGPDVFRDYLVTLDIPSTEVRLGPLPKRPDEQGGKTTTLDTTDEEEGPVSIADSAKDRYIAPEMTSWFPVFRYQQFLIVPTVIGSAPRKLFMMDTGAALGMITPAAAREVTHVSTDSNLRVKGINGEVKTVMMADKVAIAFAGVRQINEGMTSYDSRLLAHAAGVEISGLIGFPMLRELVISIDYRDNLVHVVYDPKKGFHAH